MTFYRGIVCLIFLFSMTTRALAVETGRMLEFVVDPFNPDEAWVLTEPDLQFNRALKSRGKWEVRFNRKIFQSLTRKEPGEGYRHLKLSLSPKRSGQVFLWLEAGESDEKRRYLFRSSDRGKNWSFQSVKAPSSRIVKKAPPEREAPPVTPPAPVVASVQPSEPDPKGTMAPRGPSAVVKTPIETAPTADASRRLSEHFGGGPGISPWFKIYFDLLLDFRPQVTPLTFDTYHSLFLVELAPREKAHFSFEVSPTPRFYELEYEVSPTFSVRGGRIWIPFDRMNPHNIFGGYMNISQLMQPGGGAFLPDFWTDLGIAAKLVLRDQPGFRLTGEMYVVNGFGSGGKNPVEDDSPYPDFTKAPLTDTNHDKGLGLRLEANWGEKLSLGVSGYTARYTPEALADRRLIMAGADVDWQIGPSTELRLGAIAMRIGLPPGTGRSATTRIGSYADLRQGLGGGWFLGLRGGATDNDNRTLTVEDQQILGARIGYQSDWYRFQLQHHQDLLRTATKQNYSFTALDFLLAL